MNTKDTIRIVRFIGENIKYIKESLKDEILPFIEKTMMVKPLQSERDEYGRIIPTTRLRHFANSGWIAGQVTKGLFPGDKEFEYGVTLCAILHDIGQPPFGHDGEEAQNNASKNYNGGVLLHNIEGARKIMQRYGDDIIFAMNSGKIIEEEAMKRYNTNTPSSEQLNELKNSVLNGEEPEISKKISQKTLENDNVPVEALKIIAMSAGNHNGERGTGNIIPNTSITFEEFWQNSQETYIDARADKKMEPTTIVEAIVKLSDQLSSIPNDIIDAKMAGIEDKICEGWAEPISKILNISQKEALRKLNSNNAELQKMAIELQRKLIDDVIKNSNQNQIKMSKEMEELLYGKTNSKGELEIVGLRTLNLDEHIRYTMTPELEALLYNAMSDMNDKLVSSIIDERGAFPDDLNEIFRLQSSDPTRKELEEELMNKFEMGDEYKKFYEYVLDTTPGEYELHKYVVKQTEIEYYRDIIQKAIEGKEDRANQIINRSPANTPERLIEDYIDSTQYVSMTPGKEYSDEEIKQMIDRVNMYLVNRRGRQDDIRHLYQLVPQNRYELKQLGDSKVVIKRQLEQDLLFTDEQIASRISLAYIADLSDREFIELAEKLSVITKEEKAIFERSYKEYSPKKENNGTISQSAEKAHNAYTDANMEMGDRN